MKTNIRSSISFLARLSLLTVSVTALALATAPARAATVLHTFTEDFDSLDNAPLHGQNGWTVSNDNGGRDNAVVLAADGGNVFRVVQNEYAAHAIDQSYKDDVGILVFSWTERALLASERPGPTGNANLSTSASLYSGSNAWTDPLLSVTIQRSADTSWSQTLQYTEWDGSSYVTVSVPRTGENAFLASNSITYAFAVTVDLESHTYSFTVSDASSSSVVWTSPEAIAINPALAFPRWLTIRAQGGNDGGGAFDNVTLQQQAIPEPGVSGAISGALLLVFATLRRRW